MLDRTRCVWNESSLCSPGSLIMIDIWKDYGEDVVACGKHHCIGVSYMVGEETQMVNIVFHYSDAPFSSSTFHQITDEEMKDNEISPNTLMKMSLIKEARRVAAEISIAEDKHRTDSQVVKN